MEFTIYTFGDVEVFRAALAGVAMIFSPSDGFIVSSEGMGLGALAGLGLIIGLGIMLFNGVMKQRVELGEFVMVMILFAVLFVPRFDVNVEDYNGGGIAKVDNVPLGVVVPASLISGLAKEMNVRMSTAFSTVNGYPSGIMTPQSLTGPLRLLHSLRYGSPLLGDADPVLTSNLANLVAYCLAGRAGEEGTWANGIIDAQPLDQLLTSAGAKTGLALSQKRSDPEPVLVTCSDAATEAQAQIGSSIADGTSLMASVLTATATRNNAATVTIVGSTPQITPVAISDINDALGMIQGSVRSPIGSMEAVSADLSMQYLKQVLLSTTVNKSFQCAGTSGSPEDWARCVPFTTATKQFEEDMAAGGSFFQRLMFHSMNLLFFVWICLSPVVAVVMLMLGIRGIKLAGSYLLLGAWSVSWYVGASIINFYILKQVQYELAMLGGLGKLNQATLVAFQDALGTKLGLAGDMMASVPLLMMAVLSGSVYGLTALAQRWGGRDFYDEKVNAPSVVGSSPITSMSSDTFNRNTGVYTKAGVADPSISVASSYDNAVQSLNAAKASAQGEVSSSGNAMVQKTTSRANEVARGSSVVDSMRTSHSSADRAAAQATHEVMQSLGMSEKTDAKWANEVASTAIAGVASPIPGITLSAQLSSKLGTSLGWSKDKVSQTADKINEVLSRARESVTTEDRAHAFDTSSSNRSVLATQDTESASSQYSAALKKVESVEQGYSAAAGFKESGGFQMNFKNPAEFVYAAQRNGVNFGKYENEMKELYGEDRYNNALKYAEKSVTSPARGSQLRGNPGAVHAAAVYEAASVLSPQHALMMASEAAGRPLGINTGITAGSNSGLQRNPNDVYDGSNRGADLRTRVASGSSSSGSTGSNGAPPSGAPAHGASARSSPHGGKNGQHIPTSNMSPAPAGHQPPDMPASPFVPESPRQDLSDKIRQSPVGNVLGPDGKNSLPPGGGDKPIRGNLLGTLQNGASEISGGRGWTSGRGRGENGKKG